MSICRDDTLHKRLIAKTTKTETCWLWTGAKVGKGYGMLGTSEGNRLAHRVSYKLHVGDIPDGLLVLHKCDVPNCINPSHLFVGTNTENMADMIAKGRDYKIRGESIALSKLTNFGVRMIRTTNLSARDLAEILGVSKDTIWRVRANKTWKHI